MEIPYDKLSPEALKSVIEHFVSRDGIDSGHIDVSLEKKIIKVENQLKSGKALIVFDEKSQSCNIILKDEMTEILKGEKNV